MKGTIASLTIYPAKVDMADWAHFTIASVLIWLFMAFGKANRYTTTKLIIIGASVSEPMWNFVIMMVNGQPISCQCC